MQKQKEGELDRTVPESLKNVQVTKTRKRCLFA
jgi:hypothetical protein